MELSYCYLHRVSTVVVRPKTFPKVMFICHFNLITCISFENIRLLILRKFALQEIIE